MLGRFPVNRRLLSKYTVWLFPKLKLCPSFFFLSPTLFEMLRPTQAWLETHLCLINSRYFCLLTFFLFPQVDWVWSLKITRGWVNMSALLGWKPSDLMLFSLCLSCLLNPFHTPASDPFTLGLDYSKWSLFGWEVSGADVHWYLQGHGDDQSRGSGLMEAILWKSWWWPEPWWVSGHTLSPWSFPMKGWHKLTFTNWHEIHLLSSLVFWKGTCLSKQ